MCRSVATVHPIEHLRYVARARGVDASTLVEESFAAFEHLAYTGDRGSGALSQVMIIACRRLVERHPAAAPLWWSCAHVLVASDTRSTTREVVGRLRSDDTAAVVASAIPAGSTIVTVGWPDTVGSALERCGDVDVLAVDGGPGAGGFLRRLERSGLRCDPVAFESIAVAVAAADIVVVEALAVAPGRVLAEPGSHVVAAVAASVGTPVWLVVPTGRRLHREYVDRMVTMIVGEDAEAGLSRSSDIDDLPVGLVDLTVDDRGTHVDAGHAWSPDCPYAPELLVASPL